MVKLVEMGSRRKEDQRRREQNVALLKETIATQPTIVLGQHENLGILAKPRRGLDT